jgi:hypothetical protein
MRRGSIRVQRMETGQASANQVGRWRVVIIPEVKTSSIEILEKALLPPAQAHAILKVMEVEMAYSQETLATKGDLLATKVDLRADFGELRRDFGGLKDDFGGLKDDFRGLKDDFGDLKIDFAALKGDFTLLMAEFRALEAKIDARIDGKIGAVEGRLTRWVFTCILGQTAVLAGLGYFFLAHFGR